jgi:hypothetical protein
LVALAHKPRKEPRPGGEGRAQRGRGGEGDREEGVRWSGGEEERGVCRHEQQKIVERKCYAPELCVANVLLMCC